MSKRVFAFQHSVSSYVERLPHCISACPHQKAMHVPRQSSLWHLSQHGVGEHVERKPHCISLTANRYPCTCPLNPESLPFFCFPTCRSRERT